MWIVEWEEVMYLIIIRVWLVLRGSRNWFFCKGVFAVGVWKGLIAQAPMWQSRCLWLDKF